MNSKSWTLNVELLRQPVEAITASLLHDAQASREPSKAVKIQFHTNPDVVEDMCQYVYLRRGQYLVSEIQSGHHSSSLAFLFVLHELGSNVCV